MVGTYWGRLFILPLTFLLLTVNGGLCQTKTVDFIYINSSEGEAAGGHTALRIGQSVFHCQYADDGLFLLDKTEWPDFRYRYNDLQNRTLSIAAIPISNNTYLKLKARFLSRYLLQEKRFSFLEQLMAEKRYFESLLSGKGMISVDGLGFFSSATKDDPAALQLKRTLHNQLGTSYLDDLYHKTTIQLARTRKNLTPSSLGPTDLDLYLPSLPSSGKLQNYFELIARHEAVKVLIYGHPVRSDMLLSTDGDIGQFSSKERDRLKKYQQRIAHSLTRLLTSSRPGNGYAILLQAARYHALNRSIHEQRLFTLDPFSDKAGRLLRKHLNSLNIYVPDNPEVQPAKGTHDSRPPSSSPHRTYFDQLRHERKQDAQYAKALFFAAPQNQDIAYNQLEAALGRLWELERTDSETVRIEGGLLLPGKSGFVLEATLSEKKALRKALTTAEANVALFEKQLHEIYHYDLIDRNCVTELFEILYSSFNTTEQSLKALGGYLAPGDQFSFIPFKSFHLVQKHFPAATVEILPSYRIRQLQKQYEQNGVRSLLVESNTLTSKVYDPWQEDSMFLFFTDNTLLMRPVLGTINLLYAAVGSVGGILAAPLDRGKLLNRSVKGMIFSFPELAFMNIRKGTFPAVSTN